MKFAVLFAVFAAAISAVCAASGETNAERFARGLPPLRPRNLGTNILAAKRGGPSSTPSQCSTGAIQCCDTVTTANNPEVALIIELLGIVIGPTTSVGIACSPLIGGIGCIENPVCCEDNNFEGVISIGCSPINI